MALMNSKQIRLGVDPDMPTVSNDCGGRQSASPNAFHLLPPYAMFAAAQVAKHGGDKYGAFNYMLIPVDDHINHCLQHVFAYLMGDTSDDHLSHAMVRAMFAVEVDHAQKQREIQKEDSG